MTQLLRRLRHSKFFGLSVKLGLTLIAFWFVFRGVDFAHLEEILIKQDHTLLGTAVVLMALQMMIGSVRWRLIVNALSEDGKSILPSFHAMKIYYISIFFNCCLPGTVGGDVVRVWLTKSEHIPLPLAIHSVIIDRIITLAALGVIIILMLPVIGSLAGFDPMLVYPVVGVLIVFGVWLLFNIERVLRPYEHIKIIHWILYFVDSLKLMYRRPVASLMSLALAMVTHTCYCLAAYQLSHSISLDITVVQSLALIPPVLLAATIPVSIGGWGIREAGTIGMLGLIGIPQAAALMLSIQIGLLVIVITLPASVLWILYRKSSPNPLQMKEGKALEVGQ